MYILVLLLVNLAWSIPTPDECLVVKTRENCTDLCCGWCVTQSACYEYNTTGCNESLVINDRKYQECLYSLNEGIDGVIILLIILSMVAICACSLSLILMLLRLIDRYCVRCAPKSTNNYVIVRDELN